MSGGGGSTLSSAMTDTPSTAWRQMAPETLVPANDEDVLLRGIAANRPIAAATERLPSLLSVQAGFLPSRNTSLSTCMRRAIAFDSPATVTSFRHGSLA